MTLKLDTKEFIWEVGESLLQRLKSEGIVKQVFPLHGMLNFVYYQITCSSDIMS